MTEDSATIEKKLIDSGIRPTRARVLIMLAMGRKNVHLTPEELIEYLRSEGEKSSAATIYQNLNTLAAAGLLTRFSGRGGMMLFDANLEPHHHLTCTVCGKIVDVRLDKKGDRDLKPVHFHGGRTVTDWKVSGMQIEFKGLCDSCK